jgi:imidazolonepropionase-like amidohydrolase
MALQPQLIIRITRQIKLSIVGWLLVSAVTATAGAIQGPSPSAAVVLFEGARLITGSGDAPIENAAFVVDGTSFSRVGRRGQLEIPPGAVRVDLTGKTVIPALVDAHSHIGYMRDLTSGPQNYTRENILDHLRRFAYFGVAATQAMGTDFGELAFQVRDETLKGQYPDAARFLTAGRGLAPLAEISAANMRHAAYPVTIEEGARAAVQELALRKTPAQVLVAATKTPAEILELDELGAVAPGKSADFVVLDGNPLEDITNTRKINRVYLRGREVDRAKLQAGFVQARTDKR